MRQVIDYRAKDGTLTYRVRYRSGGRQHSETFWEKKDAQQFALMLDAGGVLGAMEWLAARQKATESQTFAQWFDTYVTQLTGVTPRTRADYRKLNTRYLGDIQALPLPLITRGHITALVNSMEAKGLSAKTIKNTIHMLSACLALAVDEGHIARNPCRRVTLPKPGLDVIDARFLEPHEFARLIAEIPEHYRPLVLFLVGTGLRWSEATGLPRRNVSIERGTVRVERAWKWGGAGKGWMLGAPKSTKSRRTVNAAVIALKGVAPLLAGDPSGLVFTTPSKVAVRHNNFYARIWIPACRRAGFVEEFTDVNGKVGERTTVRIHDLRHTHASWLISDGQSLEAVQDQLGHESILTTRKVYGHLQPAIGVAVGKSASETLARALGGNETLLGLPAPD